MSQNDVSSFYKYVPTTLIIPLPSAGKVYPVESPLHKKDKVEIREMSTSEEDILTSVSLVRSNKAIDTVVSQCILDKNVDIRKLIVGDRNSIVIGLVLASYGSNYKVDVTCPLCGELNKKYDFNLNNLPIRNLTVDPVSLGVNEFAYELPKSKAKVTFKLLTSEDEADIRTIVDKTKSALNTQIDRNITTRLKKQIVSINGETDAAKIAEVIDRKLFPISDSVDLKDYIDEISPDIDTKQDFTCSSCARNSKIEIPITFEFFWRTGRRA